MNILFFRLAVIGASGLALLTTSVPALSQSVLEEVIVTARKKEESLQKVPIAISAFSADDIQRLNLQSTADIALFTPGVSYTNGIGRQPQSDRPAIRGITTIINGAANTSGAATFIDGVYVSGTTQTTAIGNLERVEILKGPQAAAFGRGTYAGAINYVTKKPSEEFEGGVRLTGAEHDSLTASAWVSGPIAEDKAYFYLGASHDEYGGEYRNTFDGNIVGDEETQALTGKLFLTPTDNLEITLTVGLEQTDDGHFASALLPNTALNTNFRDIDPTSPSFAPRGRGYFLGEAPSFDTVALNTSAFDAAPGAGPAGTRVDRVYGSLKVEWEFAGGYTLTSVTGTSSDEVANNSDVSYAAYDPIPFSPSLIGQFLRVTDKEIEDASQELKISSPLDRPFRWTAGVYYLDAELKEIRDSRVTPGGFNFFGIPGGLLLPNDNFTTEDVDNTGIFASAEWDINEQWTATIEGRYNEDDISIITVSNPAMAPVTGFEEKFTAFTPRFTVSYAPNDDINYYLNIAQGNKPGTFNSANVPDESLRAVDEETATTVELGMKRKILEGRGALNIAVYRTDLTDQQFTQVIELPNGSTASILQNVGKSEVFGIEIDSTIALTENLTVTGTYAYTDSEIKRFVSSDQADLFGGNGTFADNERLGSVAGNKSFRVPENMASLFLRYERQLASGRTFYASTDVAYEGARFAQVHNLLEAGARTLVGARIGVEFDNWDVSMWAKNLFDDDTPTDTIRYIDRRCNGAPGCFLDGLNSLPSLPSVGVPGTPGFIPNSTGGSTSPRGFALTLPRGRQVGITANFRF
jgi:iron complex outermembrane receptor protein